MIGIYVGSTSNSSLYYFKINANSTNISIQTNIIIQTNVSVTNISTNVSVTNNSLKN